MNTVIIGPGALGSLFSGALCIGGAAGSVALLDHDARRAAQLAQHGMVLERDGVRHQCAVPVSANPADLGPADLVLLCVKARDVQAALQSALAFLAPGGVIVTLQNGIGHLRHVATALAAGKLVALGVTAQGANLVAPGHVRHAGNGITRIGFMEPGLDQAPLRAVAALLSGAGLETVVDDHIIQQVWAKLMVNVGINALTAIHDCPNGDLLQIEAAAADMERAVREAARVAGALGITLAEDPVARTREVCRATALNISSMLQDVRQRRATEIDAINGALLQEAERLGLDLPVNRELVHRIKKIEQGYGLQT